MILPESNALPASTRKESALKIASKGIPIFPCLPGGKKPLIKDWPNRATTDPKEIREWWARWPDANIGIPTGERSGLLVLDVDNFTSLETLEAEHGQLPHTTTVRTGSGGMHVYLKYPTDSGIRNSAGKLGPGLDVRGDGGYVIAPPSRTTGPYEWLDKSPLADVPERLLEALRRPLSAAGEPLARSLHTRSPGQDGETIPEGSRNVRLTRIAGRLRAWGYDGTELLGELERINADLCSTPLPAGEVLKIARSAERWPVGNAKPGPSPDTLEALERIAHNLLNYRAWPGVGGKTERSITTALVLLARKHGELVPAGVRVEVSFRDLALLAAVPLRTVTRAISRLKTKRDVLRADNFDRNPEQCGALVLIHPGATDHTPTTGPFTAGENVVGGVDTLTTPRLRNSAPGILRLGKTCEAVVDHLTAGSSGTVEVPRLASLMGSVKPGSVRYLKRHIIPRLVEAGIVTLTGDVLALTADWRGNLDRERDRTGEISRLRLDVAEYNRERDAYREWLALSPEERKALKDQRARARADGFIRDLRPAGEPEEQIEPPPLSSLARAIRDYLDRIPADAGQPPGWIGSTLWAYDLHPDKPTPAEVRAAIEELGGEPYLRSSLERAREAAA
jgi:hypothetical protein